MTQQATRVDVGSTGRWASAAAYEPYMGRWSRRIGLEFVRWLGAASGGRWLDVACGTGALTAAIASAGSASSITAIDASRDYIEFASSSLARADVHFVVGDANALPFPDAGFDACVAGLLLNFLPDPARVVREMARVTAAGGRAGGYVWDYGGRMHLMRRFWDVALALHPSAARLDEATRSSTWRPEWLAARFGEHFAAVAVEPIEIAATFESFDDYWRPFLGGQGTAANFVTSLDEVARERLRQRLQIELAPDEGGRIRMPIRAFAVRGERRASR